VSVAFMGVSGGVCDAFGAGKGRTGSLSSPLIALLSLVAVWATVYPSVCLV
jgi:hypothetical protein